MIDRRTAAVIATAVFALATVPSGPISFHAAQAGAQTDPGRQFSRAALIARDMHRVEFSGGVLPRGEPLPVPTSAASVPAPTPGVTAPGDTEKGVTRSVRVSSDTLLGTPPADLTTAQVETQAEPYLTIDPMDARSLVAGWQEQRFTDGGARGLGFAWSDSAGRRWAEGLLPGLTVASGGPWERASDPWVAWGPGDRVYYASLLFNETEPSNAIGVSLSEDGGQTWGPPVTVLRRELDFNDKEAVTVDTYPDSPWYGNVYVGWDINLYDIEGEFLAQRLVVSRSTNGGRSYRPPRTLRRASTNIGVTPRVGPDGTVYAAWAGRVGEEPELGIYFALSRDGGRTWSAARRIGEMLVRGVQDVRSGGILPSFAVDRDSGDLYIAWADARWTGVDQATLIVSRDGGRTWSSPRRIGDGPANAPTFTVGAAVNGAGELAIGYYSLRNDPDRRFLTDYFVKISPDGGTRFRRSERVTRKTFDIRNAAQAGGYFLGDYVGLAGSATGFHMLWVAPVKRSVSFAAPRQPDVFTARTR